MSRFTSQRKAQAGRKGRRIPLLKPIALGLCLLLFVLTGYYMPKSLNEQMVAAHEKNASFKSKSKKWDSNKSAVLGLGTGYPLSVYERFVGSLRATGYSGYILLGIANDAPSNVVEYLTANNVTTHVVEFADKCTYDGAEGHNGKPIDSWKCLKDYPDWKITWGRFGLYQDWLADCTDCTDGIILTDVRDAYFQRDPFQVVTLEQQAPLMVFEENLLIDTTHWLTDVPIKTCKGANDEEWNSMGAKKPMLCSGNTMGSREGILDYIDVMIHEFDEWKTKPQCRTDLIGDDQSIHNYLYYTNRIKNSIAIPHRTGPLHVVGYQAARIFEEAQEDAKAKNDGKDTEPDWMLYVKDGKWQEWLPKKHGLLDEKTGMIVNMDGSPSAYVHQYDRFGLLIENWFDVMKEKNWPYNTQV